MSPGTREHAQQQRYHRPENRDCNTYIRDILGHVELATTDTHARASTEAKRKALEAAYDIVTDDLPEWNHDPGLLS